MLTDTITGDNITDDQIRELRDSSAELRRIVPWALERGHVQRYAARARCAEILNERALARYIRAICARELGEAPDYDWFWADGRDGEAADARLVRLFRAERDAQRSSGLDPTDEDVVLVLCHG